MATKEHTVSYTSIDYHSMCQKSKDNIKNAVEGIPTPHDSKEKPEDVGGKTRGYLFSSCHSSQLLPVQASCCDPSVISLASSMSHDISFGKSLTKWLYVFLSTGSYGACWYVWSEYGRKLMPLTLSNLLYNHCPTSRNSSSR